MLWRFCRMDPETALTEAVKTLIKVCTLRKSRAAQPLEAGEKAERTELLSKDVH